MPSASISGLSSGLDTSTIISQLMRLEAITQTRLKSRVSSEQSTVKSLQDLNSSFAALATQAGALGKAGSFQKYAVTSSSDLVTATGSATTANGAVSFTVDAYAKAHSLSFAQTAAQNDVVTTGSTMVTLDTLDGSTVDLETTDGTLSGLVSAINASGTGVRASTIRLDDGTFRLKVTSATTGAESDFTLKNLDGSSLLGGASVTQGSDAAITIDGDQIHSASNTFAGSVNGLSITLQPGIALGTVVDLDVTTDTAAMATSVKAMVDKVNDLLSSIDKLSAFNATTKTGGALTGESGIRNLRTSLQSTIFPGDGTSLAAFGIQSDRYGKLTFDEAAFAKAAAADPAKLTAAFTTSTGSGFADRVAALAKRSSDSIDGTITSAIKGREADITRLQDSIAAWDIRLELREKTLTKTYTALETALSSLNAQSGYLAGQLNKLNASS